jgi:ribonuclease-3
LDKAESWLEKTLQYRFRDVKLFQQALTHRSKSKQNNERLEFLGDAVLDFVISNIVYACRPDADEGDLSKLRASLVKDESLGQLALEMGLGQHLLLGSGELKTGGHRRESILADALEAIFGAVFLDRGFAAAEDVIFRVYAVRIENLPDIDDLRDPKTRLQEWLQARKMSLPDYQLVTISGEDHEQEFTVSCTVGKDVTTGNAASRRKAEQVAARAMFKQLNGGKE